MAYCEDYPCCGHTDLDPCPGRAVVSEAWYCDDCGGYHHSLYCPVEDWDDADLDDDDEPVVMEDQYLDSYMEDRISEMYL